jgi:hypothetical protein
MPQTASKSVKYSYHRCWYYSCRDCRAYIVVLKQLSPERDSSKFRVLHLSLVYIIVQPRGGQAQIRGNIPYDINPMTTCQFTERRKGESTVLFWFTGLVTRTGDLRVGVHSIRDIIKLTAKVPYNKINRLPSAPVTSEVVGSIPGQTHSSCDRGWLTPTA